MNADIFAEWLRRQGYKVHRTKSSYWYNAGPMVLQAFPYHWLINPDREELNALMLKNPVVALRYSSPFDTPGGKVSYHIVQNSPYDLEALNSKARNGIRRGMENFRIENITFEQLAKDGWYLQEDTLMRQNRQGSMTRRDWEKLCMAAVGLPGFEVFAAFSGYNIAAATIVCNIDNIYSVPFAMSHCSYLRQHVNNALFYSMISDLQKRVNNKGIFFTVQSLDAPVNVDEFKIRMGLEPKVIRQHVAMHPLVRPFVSRPVHSLVDKLHNHYPASNILAKTEGIFRFYLEGKSEVSDQNLPEFLKDDARLSGNFAGI